MVSSETTNDTQDHHAWNPGLLSDIPDELWPHVTLFREENAYVSYRQAKALADLTGLDLLELTAFRPHRLVIHALLVRVTADLHVPDGPNYEDLGLNIRKMVERIDTRYMQAEMERIESVFLVEKDKAHRFIVEQVSKQFEPPASAVDSVSDMSMFEKASRWFGKKPVKRRPVEQAESIEVRAINHWTVARETSQDTLEDCCLETLTKTVGTIVGRRGRLPVDHAIVAEIVTNQVANLHGARIIEKLIEPIWDKAISVEQYQCLPAQAKPVIMNVKGASASGKSTIRPQQTLLAEKLGLLWSDFALISPDYWRKYLLVYDAQGDHYKYSAMLTGRELEIIDKKLDKHVAGKAAKGVMSHLLIDRFRFDSFAGDIDTMPDSKLLSRFGDRVYLFFVVTHPAETVTRAWSRGKKTGRYKAVDDLLYHNVEAFTGMPSLFLSWVNSKGKKIHFEFLDNDVPEGTLPRTVAFGWNSSMIILDIELLFNIDKYRKVNITATNPDEIFTDASHNPAENTGFIKSCLEKVGNLLLADHASGKIYARVQEGTLVWWDTAHLKNASSDALDTILSTLGYSEDATPRADKCPQPIDIDTEKKFTVGRWNQPP